MSLIDHGDVPIEHGWFPDADPMMKNRDRIIEYLPRLAGQVAPVIGEGAGVMPDSRLLLLGGDCTSHAAAMAGLKRRYPKARLAIAWFDAHGDFNTPLTTPSGNVWGMPFAMLCGRGDPELVNASEAPTALEEDAALIGGQVLDEQESRMLAASPVAHFGAGHARRRCGPGRARGVGTRRRRPVRRPVHRVRPRCNQRLRAAFRRDARARRALRLDPP